MKYFELFGLPSSGKTSLLRSFRTIEQTRRRAHVVLSEDPRMTFRRLGLKGWADFPLDARSYRTGLLTQSVAGSAVDRWQMGVLSKFPQLFAGVFECLQSVPDVDRQREILLNYWRSRLSLFLSVKRSMSDTPVLTDEGLSQTAFSTISRMTCSANFRRKTLEKLLRALPSDRTVIFLRTPIEAVEQRAYQAGRAQPKELSRKVDEMAAIFEIQKNLGVKTFELEGLRAVEDLSDNLLDILGRVESQEQS